MSIILFAFIAPLLADICDEVEAALKAAIAARRLPRRARQYKFN